MKKVQEPTARKTLTVATSRIPWQPLVGLVALIVVMSVVVLSGEELKHVPPASPSFTVLHSFAESPTDGAHPEAGLTLDVAGNLYGTTLVGGPEPSACGTLGCGTVFKLTPTGTETVLHSFAGGPTDGSESFSGLIRDTAGNLYGTLFSGGAHGSGVVFKLSPSGAETVLHSFTGGADGGYPAAPLVQDAAGNLYGTTTGGGAVPGSAEGGVVFELIRCASAPSGYDFKVLYSFTGADGSYPTGALIRDSAGNLYGTTDVGGATSTCHPTHGCGVVFKLSPTGTETVLHSFAGPDGANPFRAGLARDAAGNLYGTTQNGGAASSACANSGFGTCGVVFKLSPAGTETVLHTFTGGADGANPLAGLVRDAAGNLYGTASDGGAACFDNAITCGVVFKLSPTGAETVLHTFTGGADGGQPEAGLIQDLTGNLYGTTVFGGAYGLGVVFKLTP
jgi:uncharacterized repeat protein (TIGR03803 family)